MGTEAGNAGAAGAAEASGPTLGAALGLGKGACGEAGVRVGVCARGGVAGNAVAFGSAGLVGLVGSGARGESDGLGATLLVPERTTAAAMPAPSSTEPITSPHTSPDDRRVPRGAFVGSS